MGQSCFLMKKKASTRTTQVRLQLNQLSKVSLSLPGKRQLRTLIKTTRHIILSLCVVIKCSHVYLLQHFRSTCVVRLCVLQLLSSTCRLCSGWGFNTLSDVNNFQSGCVTNNCIFIFFSESGKLWSTWRVLGFANRVVTRQVSAGF